MKSLDRRVSELDLDLRGLSDFSDTTREELRVVEDRLAALMEFCGFLEESDGASA